MCLIVVAWLRHPNYPLVVAANRDEFHVRATAAAAEWKDVPGVFAGRDLSMGGTWLGATRTGRFAAVTNVREPGQPPGKISRGTLTVEFLRGSASAGDYAQQMSALPADTFSGFNLLICDGHELWYCTNRSISEGIKHDSPQRLSPGIYGVSNHLLDTPWPKLATAKTRFADALMQLPSESASFALLADDEIVPDEHLPATGVSLEWERMLSAVFVRSPSYGTRASTLLLANANGSARLHERSFGADGEMLNEVLLNFG